MPRSERASIIKEIYALYTSIDERRLRRIENWKRYCQWCKDTCQRDSQGARERFKSSKLFIGELPIKPFCINIAKMNNEHLYHILSESKDRLNRNMACGPYILSHRIKNVSTDSVLA